jgi:hypothetical protein
MGQGYDDLILFDRDKFVDSIFNPADSFPVNKGVPLSRNLKIEKNSDSFVPAEIRSISASNGDPDSYNYKDNLTEINDHSILNERDLTSEDTLSINNLDSKIDYKLTNEIDSDKINVSDRPIQDTINNNIDDSSNSISYGTGNEISKIEKSQIDGKEKSDGEEESERSGKKGLFGWFKKKK